MSSELPPRRFLGRNGAADTSPRTPNLSATQKRRLVLSSVLALVLLVAGITREPQRKADIPPDFDTSVVASTEIRAEFSFQTIDLDATKKARDAAAEKVPPYYRIDSASVFRQLQTFQQRVEKIKAERPALTEAIKNALAQRPPTIPPRQVVQETVKRYAEALHQRPDWADMPEAPSLAVWLMPDPAPFPDEVPNPPATASPDGTVAESPNTETPSTAPPAPAEDIPITFSRSDRLAAIAREALEYVLLNGIRPVAPSDALTQRIVVLREGIVTEKDQASGTTLGQIPDLQSAQELLSTRILDPLKLEEPERWAEIHEAVLALVEPALDVTLQPDTLYTEAARERAREAVEPVLKEIAAGEIIQDRGKRWTPQSRSDARTYYELLQNEQKPYFRLLTSYIAHAILAALVLMAMWRSIRTIVRSEPEQVYTRFLLALLLLCVTTALGRLAYYFEPSGLGVPAAAAAILYAILANARLAAMISFLNAVLLSTLYGYDWRVLMVLSAMSLAGVFSTYRVRRRSDMSTAAIKATFVGLLMVLVIVLATESVLGEAVLRRLLIVVLNGTLCLLIVPSLLSPLERLFGITTDIQLLEYSDLNHPLLKRLALNIPGTFAHSLSLGQLAEAAADAIEANGLLARVCAYYHDIGKMKYPEYFIENQRGNNPHDNLPPEESARILRSHVEEGYRLAQEYALPQPILDGILEHHGTTRMAYFYDRALKKADGKPVLEATYRYPGPKPQHPETAILMIADAVESGVRSLKVIDAQHVEEFIDRIIRERAADGQFDECDMTLRQLNIVAEVLKQRVLSMMHNRIEYPEQKTPQQGTNIVTLSKVGRE